MGIPPTFEDLKQGATNTLNLANKAALEIIDADGRNPLRGEVRKDYHRLLQLLERARERVDGAVTPERVVWANKTAGRALAQALAIRKTLGLRTDVIDPLEDRDDLCLYCARDDQPPYRDVSIGDLTVRVCAGCQDAMVPWQTPTSEEMPQIRRNIRTARGAGVRSPIAGARFPLLAVGLAAVIAVTMFAAHGGRVLGLGEAPTSTPSPIPATFTPTPQAPTATPPPIPSTPTAIPQPTGGLASGSTVLYTADFTHGTPGWVRVGDENWTAVNGILTADGSNDGTLLAPETSKGLSNFAVEASIQAVKDDDYGNGYFAIDVHDSGQSDGAGIAAGFQDSGSSLAIWPLDNSGNLSSSNDTMDRHWHLYRLEVRGTATDCL